MSSSWKVLEDLDWLVPVSVGMYEGTKSEDGSEQCLKNAS